MVFKSLSLLGSQHKDSCAEKSPGKTETIGTQDCILKQMDIKLVLSSRKLGIQGD